MRGKDYVFFDRENDMPKKFRMPTKKEFYDMMIMVCGRRFKNLRKEKKTLRINLI